MFVFALDTVCVCACVCSVVLCVHSGSESTRAPGVWGLADSGKMKHLWWQHVAMHFYRTPSSCLDTAFGPLPVAMEVPHHSASHVHTLHTTDFL